jgi:hypothetical protein
MREAAPLRISQPLRRRRFFNTTASVIKRGKATST